MHAVRTFFFLFMWVACSAAADRLPRFASDEETHAWLREKSAYYRMMAADVDKRGGVRFGVLDGRTGGMAETRKGQKYILLADNLTGPARVSILIFELTNFFQEKAHAEIDERARNGKITTPVEFGLLHELIEYDGLRYHRFVLAELDVILDGGVPREMLTWVNPALTTLASYELPLAFAFVEAQAKSGHTDHYREWFWRQAGNNARKEGAP